LFKICKNNYRINNTYSTGYPFGDSKNNIEKEYAFSAADSFNTKHNYYEPSHEDYLKGFIEAIDSAEMPIHHLQSVLLHLIFKNGLPENKNIVISGEGAEGPFGWEEYHNFIYNNENDILNKLFIFYPIQKIIKITSQITHLMKNRALALEKITNINKISSNDYRHFIWSMGAYGDQSWVKDNFNIGRENIIKNRNKNIIRFCDRSIYDLLSLLCFFGEDTVTQTIWSKIGEKNKKILYYPYYSKKIIEYVYPIPWSLKLNNPKNILREVAKKLDIPEYIINRPKSGFGLSKKEEDGQERMEFLNH